MAVHSLTRWQLIESVGLLAFSDMGAWKSGVVTGGSTTTFIDATNRDEADDYFNTLVPKARLHIYSTTDGAAPQGEERPITDWTNTTATGVVTPAFTAAVELGDKYAILSDYTWEEIGAAINAAIDEVAAQILIPWVSEELTLVSSGFEYTLPPGFITIHKLTLLNTLGEQVSEVPWSDWAVIHSNPPKIRFIRNSTTLGEGLVHSNLWAESIGDGRILRIEGLGAQARLTSDLDVCNIDPTFIVHRAAEWLHSKRIRRSDSEPDEHRGLATWHKAKADDALGNAWNFNPPDSKRVEL